MNIALVGLGLIGGSMAKAIKTKTGHQVYATDINDETMLMAKMCGALDGELTPDTLGQCHVVLLALCPGAAIRWLEANGAAIAKGAVVVDLCGVKRAVFGPMGELAAKHGFCYVGGHPMAGKERGKFVNSSPELFVNASMILTPTEAATPQALEGLSNLFTDMGFSRVVFSTPQEHDRIIAFTSQLAHVVSNAYVKSPEAQRQRGFSAGSFNDMTRVAYLDEDMWTELFMLNSDHLAGEVDTLINNLIQYRDALASKDSQALHDLLKDGREKKIMAGGN